MRFELTSGVFAIQYDASADLEPAAQGALIERVRGASAEGPVGLLFHLQPTVRTVDPAVPRFWLGVLDDAGLRIVAMAIVSDALAVRMAADVFGIANTLRRKPVAVKSFVTKALPQARAWLEGQLTASR